MMGVPTGTPWPRPDTNEDAEPRYGADGEQLLGPRFDQDVNHENNLKIQNLACKIVLDREVVFFFKSSFAHHLIRRMKTQGRRLQMTPFYHTFTQAACKD